MDFIPWNDRRDTFHFFSTSPPSTFSHFSGYSRLLIDTVARKCIRTVYYKESLLTYKSDFNESLHACKAYRTASYIIFLSTINVLERMKPRPENWILLHFFNTIFIEDFFHSWTIEQDSARNWTCSVRKFIVISYNKNKIFKSILKSIIF